jgi:hypothetical protein
MKAQLRNHVAALLLLVPVSATFVAAPAAAQSAAVRPQITGLTLNADNGLAPGSQLQFAVQGTPRGYARAELGGTGITVHLREASRGMYKGTYTVRRNDRIDPTAIITARLTRSKRTAVQTFTYPPSFQALAMGGPPVAVPAPSIDRFAVRPVRRIEPGRELRFALEGAPRATVSVDIPGVVSDVPLREVSPGVYEGGYTVRRRDDVDAFETAVATLRIGGRTVTARSDRFERIDRDREPERHSRDRRWGRDDVAPQISDLEPRNGEVVPASERTVVAANLDDRGGSGVDPATVRLMLNGRDVTAAARVTPDELRYRGDLPPGRHRAEITARDHAGNTTTKTWSFDVGGGTFGVGPAR